jgi:hypothetical protein
MLDDVAKQVLTLAARSKRSAPQNVFQQSVDLGSSGKRNRIEQRVVLTGQRKRIQQSFRITTRSDSMLPLKVSISQSFIPIRNPSSMRDLRGDTPVIYRTQPIQARYNQHIRCTPTP